MRESEATLTTSRAARCGGQLHHHCELRTGLRPVPLDETGHPLFRTLRPHFAGRTASLLLLFRTKATLGCFATSLLAMTIQLDRRPLAAGANGGGIKAPSKPFSKLLQNSRVLLQAFPSKSLAVSLDFNGLQVFQRPLMLSKFFASGRPLSAAFA